MTKVLVVDDDRDAADTLVVLLRLWGYTTAAAYNGVQALELADTFRPDVVLLDLRMPGVSGFAVARRLRSQPRHRTMHLVALTGYGTTQDKTEAYRAGFDCHLLKPVDVVAVNAVLRRYARRIKLGTRPRPANRASRPDTQPLID
jgi:CheY-like chemotaxis protein